MGEEFKKYDDAARWSGSGIRLAKDAEVRENEHGKMVRLTFVSTSRREAHSDLWLEANVADRQADLAACFKKGDILHNLNGEGPRLRRYGDNNEKFALSIERAEFVAPIDLFVTCRDERGFVPGAKAEGKGKPTGTAKQGAKPPVKPAGKPAAKPAGKPRPVVDIDDSDDE